MKYVFFILVLGFIINFYMPNVNHVCESSQSMGRTVVKNCDRNEAFNIVAEEYSMFGRSIVK